MTIATIDVTLYLLVFMRMTGAVIFNPIFGRTNVPAMVKVGLSLCCTLVVAPTLPASVPNINGPIQFIVMALLELFVGLAVGVLVNLLFSVVTVAGEYIDMQMGLAMATLYDPGSGINMPVFGSFLNFLMIAVFFASDSHLALISLFADSFKAIPPGTAIPTAASLKYLIGMGADMFEMGLRMAIPILAVELICIVAIGMLMRAEPQINIFTVGVQVQAIVGFIVILFSIPVIVAMCGRLSTFILEKSAELLRLMIH